MLLFVRIIIIIIVFIKIESLGLCSPETPMRAKFFVSQISAMLTLRIGCDTLKALQQLQE